MSCMAADGGWCRESGLHSYFGFVQVLFPYLLGLGAENSVSVSGITGPAEEKYHALRPSVC